MSNDQLAEMLQPKPLTYYESMTQDGAVTVQLSQTEKAAILKAYDHGFQDLNAEELNHLYGAVAQLKQEI